MSDYIEAKKLKITDRLRWANDDPHHPMSERLMAFLRAHDAKDYAQYFDWSIGGDGDNGETLMYQMDAFFDLLDIQTKTKISNIKGE